MRPCSRVWAPDGAKLITASLRRHPVYSPVPRTNELPTGSCLHWVWNLQLIINNLTNDNNNAGILLLRRLHQNKGERVINKLWPEVAFTKFTARGIDGGVGSLTVICAMQTKCETFVLTKSQPPTSQPLTLRKALLPPTNCRYQFTDREGMDSLVS